MKKIIKVLNIIFFLYLFLLSIELLGSGFKFLGEDFAKNLFTITAHPGIGIFIGLLATAIVQSSSFTTSMIVALVSSGTIGVKNAVFLVMGANIGTTVTNTLVSLSYVTRKEEFGKAFAASVVHDFFNIIMVTLFAPLELATGFLSKTAGLVANFIIGSKTIEFHSPLKLIVKPVNSLIIKILNLFLNQSWIIGAIITLISVILLFIALLKLVTLMKSILINRIEISFNNVIEKAPVIGIILGFVITAIIQSSSVTTSMLVPIVAAGVISIDTAFAITLGANIGTTVTALLASLVGNKFGLTIALVHFFFNFLGVLIISPFRPVRRIPITMAEKLGEIVKRNRNIALLYVGGVFFVIPGIVILISKLIFK